MSVNVTFINDIYDHKDWKHLEGDELFPVIINELKKWPANARLYHGEVSAATEITPRNEADLKAIEKLQGQFFVVDYPGFGADILLYAALAVTVVAAFVFKPKIPSNSERSYNSKSPNNELSQRVNNPRPNGRIPDIFGTVRSTPDLIALPYDIYIGGKQVEMCLMCIGRGQHDILDCRDGTTDVGQIAGTSVNIWHPYKNIVNDVPYYIKGERILEPVLYVFRNNGVNGQTLDYPRNARYVGINDIFFFKTGLIQIVPWANKAFEGFKAGDTVSIINAKKLSSNQLMRSQGYPVNSKTIRLKLPNNTLPPVLTPGATFILYTTNVAIQFMTVNIETIYIDLSGTYTIDKVKLVTLVEGDPEAPVTNYYAEVKFVTTNNKWNQLDSPDFKGAPLTQLDYDVNNNAVLFDLAGTYTIQSVSGKNMQLVNPAAVNGYWNNIPVDGSGIMSPTITTLNAMDWIGPFVIDQDDTTVIQANFVGSNGVYGDTGDFTFPLYIVIWMGVTPVDENHNPIGPEVVYTATVGGNEPLFANTDSQGVTLRIDVPAGRYRVRASRQTPKLNLEGWQIVDEIKWKDLFGATPVTGSGANFGNVTILRSRTVATEGALSVKERKLNLLVTRQIPLRVSGSTFTTTLHSTNNVDQILSEVCRDPKLGARLPAEIDYDNIFNTIQEARDYFGMVDDLHHKATEFCYTFDEDDMTFEDMAAAIADAVFCVAYRQGSVIRIKFERAVDDSVMLFNHRNKVPGSETRTITFGPSNNYDGLAFQWVDPKDDALVTMYIPSNRTAQNEKKIESIGIRNFHQAYLRAWREYNKLLYQNQTINFDATAEAELLVVGDRMLVADNTRPDTQDGEVVRSFGLLVETSQKVEFLPGFSYVAFFQLPNRTVEGIPVSAVPGDEYAMMLAHEPSVPLVWKFESYARTVYTIARSGQPDSTAFLLADRETNDDTTSSITAYNYDARYYARDKDFAPVQQTFRWYALAYAPPFNPFAWQPTDGEGSFEPWYGDGYLAAICDMDGVLDWQVEWIPADSGGEGPGEPYPPQIYHGPDPTDIPAGDVGYALSIMFEFGYINYLGEIRVRVSVDGQPQPGYLYAALDNTGGSYPSISFGFHA